METTAPLSKRQLNDILGGLFMMIIFTAVWVFIGEWALQDHDHGATAGGFGIIVVFMSICYVKLAKQARSAPEDATGATEAEKAKDKRFYIIFAIEGIAIFAAKNILLNTGHDNLFFPVFALIVGLHFFPLGRVFNHTFYYVIGAWICLVAILGFALIYAGISGDFITGTIGIGCALATAGNGIRLIRLGGVTVLDI